MSDKFFFDAWKDLPAVHRVLWAVCSTGQDKLEFQRKIVEALRNFRDASGWCECGPEQEGSMMGVREREMSVVLGLLR